MHPEGRSHALPPTGVRSPIACLFRHAMAAARALRAAPAWAWTRFADSRLGWVGLTQALPIGGLAACWLLERDTATRWLLDSPQRWLSLASVALVVVLHDVVLVLLFLESRPDHPGAAPPGGIPPP